MNKIVLRDCEVRNFCSDDLKGEDNLIQQVSQAFCEVFAREYGQFLCYPSKGKPISVIEAFGEKGENMNFEQLYSLFSPAKEYPLNPEDNEPAIFWHSQDVVRDIIREKLSQDGYLTTIFHDEKLAGVNFGYVNTLRNIFEKYEEWKNPILYSGIEHPPILRDFDTFLKSLNEVVHITADQELFCWNCTFLMPKFRGANYYLLLMRSFFSHVDENIGSHRNILGIGEIIEQIKANAMFQKIGIKTVPNALGEDHHILYHPLEYFIQFKRKSSV